MTIQAGGPATSDRARKAEGTRIRSVARAVRALGIVAAAAGQGVTARDLATALGAPLPTTYHLLNTLMDARMIYRDEWKRFRLGVGVEALASAYYRQVAPPPALLVPLQGLVERTGETAYLTAWRHGELEILACRAGTHAVRVMALQPGFHELAHARASGKLLLALGSSSLREDFIRSHPLHAATRHTITDRAQLEAELDAIARVGYALDQEEFYEGVCGISVPIVHAGDVLGAYTISAPMHRFFGERESYLEHLRWACELAVASESAVADAV